MFHEKVFKFDSENWSWGGGGDVKQEHVCKCVWLGKRGEKVKWKKGDLGFEALCLLVAEVLGKNRGMLIGDDRQMVSVLYYSGVDWFFGWITGFVANFYFLWMKKWLFVYANFFCERCASIFMSLFVQISLSSYTKSVDYKLIFKTV